MSFAPSFLTTEGLRGDKTAFAFRFRFRNMEKITAKTLFFTSPSSSLPPPRLSHLQILDFPYRRLVPIPLFAKVSTLSTLFLQNA